MKFDKGDKVKFELNGNNTNIPRWDMNTDQGSSGKYCNGTVVSVGKSQFTVEYIRPTRGDSNKWKFSYKDQHQPGFPVLDSEQQQQTKFKTGDWVKFELGSSGGARWDSGCDNGSTDQYCEGKVIVVDGDNDFCVEYSHPASGGASSWYFNYIDRDKEGFPELLNKAEKQKDEIAAFNKWLDE